MKYAVIIEPSPDGSWWAYVPDLPGCTSAGASADEVRANVREAIDFHIESLREHNEPVPLPTTRVAEVEAA